MLVGFSTGCFYRISNDINEQIRFVAEQTTANAIELSLFTLFCADDLTRKTRSLLSRFAYVSIHAPKLRYLCEKKLRDTLAFMAVLKEAVGGGPLIAVYNKEGKMLGRTLIRPSGTESLGRMYMEVLDPMNGTRPENLYSMFLPMMVAFCVFRMSICNPPLECRPRTHRVMKEAPSGVFCKAQILDRSAPRRSPLLFHGQMPGRPEGS